MNHQGQQLFLGLDGGASAIRIAVINEQAKPLLEERIEVGANYQALDLPQVVEHIEQAVQLAIAKLDVGPAAIERSVLGLAGCNFASDRQLLEDALRKSAVGSMLAGGFKVVNDSLIALRAGTSDGVGVVIIAGTGSNCYGRTADGREAQAGGLNHILSDEGSGYDIGKRALQAVVQSLDGRSGETALTQAVFDHLAVDNLEDLYRVVYSEHTTKAQVAAFAKLAVELAEKRDPEAQDILNHSVNELLLMVDAVLRKLELRDEAVPVVAVGSIIGSRNYVRQRFQAELLRIAPRARLVKPEISSARGAALMALEGGN